MGTRAKAEAMSTSGAARFGVSFTPGGLLLPYYLGVGEALEGEGVLVRGETPLAGSSVGSLAAAMLCSRHLEYPEMLEACRALMGTLRAQRPVYLGRVEGVLRPWLEDVLPEDVHLRANGCGVSVAVTRLEGMQPMQVSEFTSKQDLVDAVVTSCFIPGYLAPASGVAFRDLGTCLDGMPTCFSPDAARATEGACATTLRVCATPATAMGWLGLLEDKATGQATRIDISPDVRRLTGAETFAEWARLTWLGLVPYSDAECVALQRAGVADTEAWLRSAEARRTLASIRDDTVQRMT